MCVTDKHSDAFEKTSFCYSEIVFMRDLHMFLVLDLSHRYHLHWESPVVTRTGLTKNTTLFFTVCLCYKRAYHFTDDQVSEPALASSPWSQLHARDSSSEKLSSAKTHDSPCVLAEESFSESEITRPKGSFGSLGPIRASLEHFLVITQSVLSRIPAQQSVSVRSPPKTVTIPSQVTVMN